MTKLEATTPCLLTPAEMADADRTTVEAGIPGIVLMENAGRFVATIVQENFPQAYVFALLAGPGNNGGDAYVVARALADAGKKAVVFALTPTTELSGDAAIAANAYQGNIEPIAAFDPSRFDLVVDGLFGAGLSRPVEGAAAAAILKANAGDRPIVAIDLPSGVSGLTGAVPGVAVQADLTVTFFRRKPGHLLLPGRLSCAEVIVGDIGIAPTVLDQIQPRTFANCPALWRSRLSLPTVDGHKYDRGHCVVFSGNASHTGAARLAAQAALRGGAGLVTLACPGSALLVNAAHLVAVMLSRIDDVENLAEILKDERFNAFVLGPGFGIGGPARDYALAVLEAERRLVLDADGLSSFKDCPEDLFETATRASHGRKDSALVCTPHAGEFARLFPDIAANEEIHKVDKARTAAERSGAVVVLKGPDTVIAAPDGRAAINAVGTPWLATAGTGDVLAGLAAAQLSQGMPSFEAACAAVWMHGRAAELFGPGLISEDLPAMLPRVVAELAGPAP